MSKRMENILCNHTNSFVLLEQFPFAARIVNHPLHHVVNRNEISKKAMTSAIFDYLQLCGNNRILKHRGKKLFCYYQIFPCYRDDIDIVDLPQRKMMDRIGA